MHVSFSDLPDLAAEVLGGIVLDASDEFFAPKENLIKSSAPVFVPDRYTDRGKWMDGWESRRRRGKGHDWCVVTLGCRGIIRGINIDTSHFFGNYPEYCSIDANSDDEWRSLVPKSPLRGGIPNYFSVNDEKPARSIRLNIFPDGGVARLRVHGEVVPELKRGELVDLASIKNGGRVVACSDMFFSHKDNLIMPGRSSFMGGGWETRRRRGPGHDWIVIRFWQPGIVSRVEIDTHHYKGNYPESASVAGALLEHVDALELSEAFEEVLPRIRLQADAEHMFEKEIVSKKLNYVKLSIYPDGGIARLRVFCRA